MATKSHPCWYWLESTGEQIDYLPFDSFLVGPLTTRQQMGATSSNGLSEANCPINRNIASKVTSGTPKTVAVYRLGAIYRAFSSESTSQASTAMT